MLTEKDLDLLMQQIQSGEKTYLYYVAHMIEPREGLMDEHFFKSSAKFKVIKLELTGIENAYFEYLNYLDHPENYHIETEETYYDFESSYIHHYIVPNYIDTGKEFNPRTPSIIYGYCRKIRDLINHEDRELSDVSPIKQLCTNEIQYGDLSPANVNDAFANGLLDWKYLYKEDPILIDGIEYHYITSKWYILDIKNFPQVEKPLIHTEQYCSYFRDIVDAFNFIDQLKA
jgi:hypothetical protein